MVILPKAWDVLIDPAVGALSDREARSRGTRTRLMAVGALTLPIGFIGMFAAPTGLSPVLAGVWVLVFFVLPTSSFSLFQVPYIALPAGLISSTALTLLLVPVLYRLVEGWSERRRSHRGKHAPEVVAAD